jgi:hypothetical protein
MRYRQTDPNLGRAGKAYPSLEALEDRTCPSTISLQSGILTITGDNSANTVTVRDAGNGNVSVNVKDANGHVTTKSAKGVSDIRINANGGDDRVNYALTGVLTKAEKISINLGNGNNRGMLDFSKGISASALTLRVQGGSGNDRLDTTFGAIKNTALDFRTNLGGGNDQVFTRLNGALTGTAKVYLQTNNGPGYDGVSVQAKANIAATASLQIDTLGGTQPDTVHVDYSGQLNGKLTIHTQGGPHFSWLESNITLNAGSTGKLEAKVNGGAGDDLLILRVFDNSHHLHSLLAQLDGGGGENEAIATHNVKVLHAATS